MSGPPPILPHHWLCFNCAVSFNHTPVTFAIYVKGKCWWCGGERYVTKIFNFNPTEREMAIITLQDQLTIMRSHLASIERAIKQNDYSAVASFFGGIITAATSGQEYAQNIVTTAEKEPLGGESGQSPT